MSERVCFTVLIYLNTGKDDVFRSYEEQAFPLIGKHGGRIELIIKPEEVTGELDLPDEIHVLSFETKDGFANYRADPGSQQLAQLRTESVARAVFLRGRIVRNAADPGFP